MASQSSDAVLRFSYSSSVDAWRLAASHMFTKGQETARRSKSEPSDTLLPKQAKEYWNSLEPKEREKFLEISISDLRGHFSNSEYGKVLTNILSYVEDHNASKFFACCKCSDGSNPTQTFSDPDLLLKHIKRVHIENQLPLTPALLPVNKISKVAEDIIINGEWKPAPIGASDDECPPSASVNASYVACGESSFLRAQERELPSLAQKRADRIKTIHQKFLWFLENGCFSRNHLKEVFQFTKKELCEFPSSLELLWEAISLLPRSICSLDSDQLDGMSTFLEELQNSCEGAEDMDCPPEVTVGEQMLHPLEKTLSWDSIKLRLNQSYFLAEHRLCESQRDLDESEIDKIMFSSLYSSRNLIDLIAFAKYSNGNMVLQRMEAKFDRLRTDLMERCRLSSYDRILIGVEQSICDERCIRESIPGYSIASYKSIVSERVRADLSVSPVPGNSSFAMEFLCDVLKEAHNYLSLHVQHSLCGPSASYENELAAWNALVISDDIVARAIQSIRREVTLKICKSDARILQTIARIKLYDSKLKAILSFDSSLSLVSFMKIFIRSQLEVLGVQHAAQKADATRVTLIKEKASGGKDNIQRSSKRPRPMQEKSKNKDKKRKRQKSEGIEECDVIEDLPEKEEEMPFRTTVVTATGKRKIDIPNQQLYDRLIIEPEIESSNLGVEQIQKRRQPMELSPQRRQPMDHSQTESSFFMGDFNFGTLSWPAAITEIKNQDNSQKDTKNTKDNGNQCTLLVVSHSNSEEKQGTEILKSGQQVHLEDACQQLGPPSYPDPLAMAKVEGSTSTSKSANLPSPAFTLPGTQGVVYLPAVAPHNQFTGENLHQWCRFVKHTLIPLRLEDHLTKPPPGVKDVKYPPWRDEEDVIIKWLMVSMRPELRDWCILYRSVKEIWEAVNGAYSKFLDKYVIEESTSLAYSELEAEGVHHNSIREEEASLQNPRMRAIVTRREPRRINPGLLPAIKLTKDNYVVWRAQFIPVLRSHELLQHITDLPPSEANESDEWRGDDQHVLSCLFSTITESAMTGIPKARTAKQVWDTLAANFVSSAQAHIQELLGKLEDYISGICSISSSPLASEEKIDQNTMMQALLRGLGPQYVAVVEYLRTHPTPPNFEQAVDYMRGHEAMLSHQQIAADRNAGNQQLHVDDGAGTSSRAGLEGSVPATRRAL